RLTVAVTGARDLADRRDDARVGPAPAQVATHPFGDLRVVEGGLAAHVLGGGAGPAGLGLVQHARGRADLTGRAVTALEPVVVEERLVKRLPTVVGRQAGTGGDVGAVVGDGQRQAGRDSPPVQQHRARAALAVVTALLRGEHAQPVAQ